MSLLDLLLLEPVQFKPFICFIVYQHCQYILGNMIVICSQYFFLLLSFCVCVLVSVCMYFVYDFYNKK